MADMTKEEIEQEYYIKIVNMGIKCPKCGRVWGVICDGIELQEINPGRFICTHCYQEFLDKKLNQ